MDHSIDISIITPSLNMFKYLKCCVASINDQSGVAVEHIILDGGSKDGTREWLKNQDHLKSICEKDNGMYDAINKGLKISKGKILAYLNCDEQYLPGTLKYVTDYFEKNPRVDILFGDSLLIRPNGSLVAFRKGYHPRWHYIITSHLYVLSCTMFFRRKIIEEDYFFDNNLKAVGDADFVIRILKHGFQAKHLKKYFSAFTMTGKNLSIDPNAVREHKQLQGSAPFFIRINKWFLNVARLTGKFLNGSYFQKMPLEYSVFTQNNDQQRQNFSVNSASFRWKY